MSEDVKKTEKYIWKQLQRHYTGWPKKKATLIAHMFKTSGPICKICMIFAHFRSVVFYFIFINFVK